MSGKSSNNYRDRFVDLQTMNRKSPPEDGIHSSRYRTESNSNHHYRQEKRNYPVQTYQRSNGSTNNTSEYVSPHHNNNPGYIGSSITRRGKKMMTTSVGQPIYPRFTGTPPPPPPPLPVRSFSNNNNNNNRLKAKIRLDTSAPPPPPPILMQLPKTSSEKRNSLSRNVNSLDWKKGPTKQDVNRIQADSNFDNNNSTNPSSHNLVKTNQEPNHNLNDGLIKSTNTWGSRTVEMYDIISKIGEGMYGYVYKAKHKETGEIVALKRIRLDASSQGFPITAIREVKILKSLNHENIVKLKDVVCSIDVVNENIKECNANLDFFLVFEYLENDLAGLLESGEVKFTIDQIVDFMKQLLQGLEFCHDRRILHRDLKGSNLLLSNTGILKLADFGLSRTYFNDRKYTNKVITLWYRPPELLLATDEYSTAVDIWSVGCIFAELLSGRCILPGRDEMSQLELICRLCGTPNEYNWRGVSLLPGYRHINQRKVYKRRLKEEFQLFNTVAIDLLDSLLQLDPSKRPTCREALAHSFFQNIASDSKSRSMNIGKEYHEYSFKKKQHNRQCHDESRSKKLHRDG